LRVRAVHAVSFRLYARLDAGLADGLTAVVGANGAGKTSLLEAVHFGCTGYSSRTSAEAQCVREGDELLRVEVEGVSAGRPCRTAVGFRPGEPKRVVVDGAPARSVEALAERWACLVFTPDRLALVKRSAAVRRAYLDRAVARIDPPAARASGGYARALAQRNALLRRVRAGAAPPAALDPWDEQAASLGAEITAARRRLCERLAPLFRERVGRLGGRNDEAWLRYLPRGDEDPAAALAALRAGRRRDVERAVTGSGPHLDDVLLAESARAVRAYGSQGEQRTAVLALLLAEATVLRETRGEPPVLLLDDVLSELDERRRRLLLDAVREHGQTVVTTADPRDLPEPPDRVLEVAAGALSPAGPAPAPALP
jgi:DNA replication and repair protein RecF